MIRLSRSIQVLSFDVEATLAVGRDRPEFLAVARLAADLGRPIGARDVLRELLGERPEVLGWRVIERCVALGLLERERKEGPATLSASGRLALAHGEVLVPEEGVWRLYFVDDPLVPDVLLHAERLETDPVQKERNAMKEARKRGAPRVQPDLVPEQLRRCADERPRVSIQSAHLLRLLQIAERGAVAPDGSLRLTLSWAEAPELRLTGQLLLAGDRRAPIDATLDIPKALHGLTREALWKALVGHATGVPLAELDRWRALKGFPVVPSSFESLPAAARHAFRRDLDVPAFEWRDLGEFEPTVLKDVDLVPATDADAQRWLEWLQWESLNDYVTTTQIERSAAELSSRFPHHRARAVGPRDLLAKALAERGERSWYLLAPADLGLWS